MSALNRRMAKLESTERKGHLNPELTVILRGFGGGEYVRAEAADGTVVERLPDEQEEAFMERAPEELCQLERAKPAPAIVLTVRMIRDGDDADTLGSSAIEPWPGGDLSTQGGKKLAWPLPSTSLD